ncbi:GNAT family N-acetyltransferase [Pseudohoeflea coraliihabitans]|uniref:GNAT family N-acetyltransferase n=1 Tax=Pseudohoeflea coraliihabitans TaxID=2860393 RepID=A0ABS6WLC8_9HYPH|nr:GNAT family N-acetyltransferase [Pseudohoeflea sp. DP4N28-3]MBW3096736.1 GNAT family N-acetyltransferase [Pseudohoeflea sp. DP4N28-3]
MQIRDARETDLGAITAIYADSVDHGVATYELSAPGQNEMQARYQNTVKHGYPYLAAEQEGQILGFAYAGAFRTRPAYNWICEDSIYLAPEARGKGVGSALLASLIERCTEKGLRQMIAVIGGAHPASIAVHHKAGFAETGRLAATGFKHGRWLDTVFMSKPLGPGSTTLPDPDVWPGPLYR